VLDNTIPPHFKTEAVNDVITYIENLLRVTDSSLLDEWEMLRNPDYIIGSGEAEVEDKSTRVIDITRDRESFMRLVRNEVFRFLRMLANKNYQEITESFEFESMFPGARSQAMELEQSMTAFYENHEWIRLDPGARAKGNTRVSESDDRLNWTIEQTLVDPEELNDFQFVFRLSIEAAKKLGQVELIPVSVGPISVY